MLFSVLRYNSINNSGRLWHAGHGGMILLCRYIVIWVLSRFFCVRVKAKGFIWPGLHSTDIICHRGDSHSLHGNVYSYLQHSSICDCDYGEMRWAWPRRQLERKIRTLHIPLRLQGKLKSFPVSYYCQGAQSEDHLLLELSFLLQICQSANRFIVLGFARRGVPRGLEATSHSQRTLRVKFSSVAEKIQ